MTSQRFDVLEPVGAGNFGVIRRGVDREAKSPEESAVAVKELKRPINLELLNREIKLQYRSQMVCRNVVQLHHIIESRPNEKYLLVMELLPMDMRCFLTAFYCPHRASLLVPPDNQHDPRDAFQATYGRRYVPLMYIKRMLTGLLTALASVHGQGIAHRDVKPENILIEPLGLAKPLRAMRTPCASSAGLGSGLASAPESSVSCTEAKRAVAPLASNPLCVALQDGMTVEEIIAATRAMHCAQCHAQFAEKQPRLAALTAAALSTHTGPELESSKAGADGTEWTTAAGTETAAGVSDSNPSNSAAGTQESSLTESGSNAESSPTGTEIMQDWLVKASAAPRKAESPTDAAATTPPNFSPLLALQPEVKLGDFGSARDMRPFQQTGTDVSHNGLTGCPTTYVYCAPEMMLQQVYTTSVDVWAAGMILFELATGELLLRPGQLVQLDGNRQANSDFSITYRLMRMLYMLGVPTETEWAAIANPSTYPHEMLAVLPQVHGCPLFDAAAAAAAQDISGADSSTTTAAASPAEPAKARKSGAHRQESEVLGRLLYDSIGADGVDLMRGLIAYNPADRLSASEALQHPFLRT